MVEIPVTEVSGNGHTPLIVQEMIGREASLFNKQVLKWRWPVRKSIDATRTNYEFWDKLRRCKEPGYELGALFAKPIADILTAHVLGDGIEMTVRDPELSLPVDKVEYTNRQLKDWLRQIHGILTQTVGDMYGLGDQFIIVNPDGSLSIPSPDMVEVEWHPLDYRRPIKFTVTSKLEKIEVEDSYTDTLRTLKVKNITNEAVDLQNGITLRAKGEEGDSVTQTFNNLIGRIPVVQWSHGRSANELYGRPVYEALLTLFSRYDDLMNKALIGAEMMGMPIPTFEGMENPDETIELNTRSMDETDYTDIDGSLQERPQIIFDQDTVVIVGKGGRFVFVAPQAGFTSDVRGMLKMLFLLMLEYARIPESVWGGEMGQARATSVEQMKTFYSFITAMRVELERMGGDGSAIPQNGLLALVDIWLRMRRLTDPRIVVAPVRTIWPEISLSDEKLNFEKIQFAQQTGLITDAETLKQLRLPGIDDEEAMVKAAQKEAEAARDAFDRGMERDLAQSEENLRVNDEDGRLPRAELEPGEVTETENSQQMQLELMGL